MESCIHDVSDRELELLFSPDQVIEALVFVVLHFPVPWHFEEGLWSVATMRSLQHMAVEAHGFVECPGDRQTFALSSTGE